MTRSFSKPSIALAIIAFILPAALYGTTAVDDSYTTARTQTLSIAAPGLLGNDGCDPCTVVIVDGQSFSGQITFGGPSDGDGTLPPLASGASLTVFSDGSFTYDPTDVFDPNLASDSFTYQAYDSHFLSAAVTVTITLTDQPAGSPPVAVDDTYSVEVGGLLDIAAPGLLGNDSDPDGDPLTIALLNGSVPTFGSPVALANGDLTLYQDGSFTYQPYAGATPDTDDGFSYTASDGTSQSNQGLVTLSLVGTASGDGMATVRFDDVLTVDLSSDVGVAGVDQLTLGAPFDNQAVVSAQGLPSATQALVLRNPSSQNDAEALAIFRACERMGLLAQSNPGKYDLTVEITSSNPAGSFSSGGSGDGEVIVDVSQTQVRCQVLRTTSATAP